MYRHPEDELAENRRLEQLGYQDIDSVVGSCDPVCDARKDGIGDGTVERELLTMPSEDLGAREDTLVGGLDDAFGGELDDDPIAAESTIIEGLEDAVDIGGDGLI